MNIKMIAMFFAATANVAAAAWTGTVEKTPYSDEHVVTVFSPVTAMKMDTGETFKTQMYYLCEADSNGIRNRVGLTNWKGRTLASRDYGVDGYIHRNNQSKVISYSLDPNGDMFFQFPIRFSSGRMIMEDLTKYVAGANMISVRIPMLGNYGSARFSMSGSGKAVRKANQICKYYSLPAYERDGKATPSF